MVLNKDGVITSSRLKMKAYSENDTAALVDLLTNPDITKYFMVPTYETQEEYAALARKLIEFSRPEDTEHLEYGIYLDDRLIGFINDCGIEEDTIEIGYVIHPDYQGHGYASESVTAILGALKRMGFKTVQAGYFEENTASLRVMEKCGMHRIDKEETGEYRGVMHRCLYCEIEL